MSKLSLHLLGPPQIELDGEVIDLRRRKVLALLTYLTVTEQPQSREVLTDLLYPRSDRSHARGNFRRSLSRLKKALGAEWIHSDNETVSIAGGEGLWVDIKHFRQLMERAGRLHQSTGVMDDELIETLREAVKLYRGEFLSGFYLKDSPQFDDWQFFQQESLREKCAFSLEMLVQVYSARSQYKTAIEYAQKWLSLDPLAESVHRQLMRLYSVDGQSTAALRQYRKCRSILSAELGVVPEETTEKLHREIQKKRSVDPLEREAAAETRIRKSEASTRVVTVLVTGIETETGDKWDVESERKVKAESSFHGKATKILTRYEAYVERSLMGETVAVSGYPHSHEDDVERALNASIEIEEEIEKLDLRVSQGISTGTILVQTGERRNGENRLSMTGRALQRAAQLRYRANAGVILTDRSTYNRAFRTFVFKPRRISLSGAGAAVYQLMRTRYKSEKTYGIEGLRTPLIGRSDEMEKLKQVLLETGPNEGCLVSVIGEAGVGKSRLISELKNVVFSHGYSGPPPLWLEGRCQEMGMTTAYWPFLRLLNSFFLSETDDLASGINSLLSSLAEQGHLAPDQIEEIAPLLSTFLTAPIDGSQDASINPADPKGLHFRTFQAMNILFEALSKRQPLVLVFEDLHWADTLSMDLISSLTELLAATSIFLICVFRAEGEGKTRKLRDIAFKKCGDRYTEIKLDKLTTQQSREMIDSFLNPNKIALTVKELIATMAEGYPLYLEEVIRSMINSGAIFRRENSWCSQEDVPMVFASENILRIVQDRTDVLDGDARIVLQHAAIIGPVFSRQVLKEVTSPDTNLEEVLHTLDIQDFIFEESTMPERVYSFKHVLVQKAVYQMIPPSQRKILNRQVGDAIEEIYKNNLYSQYERLAYHYELANTTEKALAFLVKAGQKSAGRYANNEALTYFEKALHLVPDEADRMIILKNRAKLFLNQFKGNEAAGDYRDLLESSKRNEDHQTEFECLLGLAGSYFINARGETDKIANAKELHKRAYRLAQELEDGKSIIKTVAPVGYFRYVVDDLLHKDFAPLKIQEAEEAVEISRQIGDEEVEIDCLMTLLAVLKNHRHMRKAEELGDRLRARLESRKDLNRQRELLHILKHIYFGQGKLEKCIECCDSVMRLSAETGSDPERIATLKAWALMFLGRFDEAWKSIQQEAIEEKKVGSIKALDLCIKGCYFLYLLDYKKAVTILRDVIDNQEIGSAGVRQNAITYLARALIRTGQMDCEKMRRISSELSASRYPEARLRILCEYYLSQGKLAEALEHANKTYNVARKASKRIAQSKSLELKLRILLKMDQPADAIPVADTAIAIAERYRYLPDLWRIRASKARALEMLGEAEKAAEEYKVASAIIRKIARTVKDLNLRETFLSNPEVSSVLDHCKAPA